MFSLIIDMSSLDSNKALVNIILCISMEIYLIHKKSNWKFAILAIVLLSISIILNIIHFVLPLFSPSIFLMFQLDMIVSVLASVNYIVIGFVILKFLRKTVEENLSLKSYVKPISIGIVFIYLIQSLITPIYSIIVFISYSEGASSNISILFGSFSLSRLIFIIGIIFLSIGAIKTMFVPLVFSKDKDVKGFITKTEEEIPPKEIIYCTECGTSLPSGVKFCNNCGKRT